MCNTCKPSPTSLVDQAYTRAADFLQHMVMPLYTNIVLGLVESLALDCN
jgi:hypothetical protein